jgi:hypothetical protein
VVKGVQSVFQSDECRVELKGRDAR